ncbi:hypothetical protein [Streptomyces sp. LN785]|uniref:hypothetical protein n=1 Tax=Streptomyces sp. LN785 TaxID=3112983 RepID=UPI003712FBBE
MSPRTRPEPDLTIRPALRFGLLLVAPGAVLLLPRVVLSEDVRSRMVWSGLLIALLAVSALTRLTGVSLDREGVTVRLGRHVTRIAWTELVSVSVRRTGGSGRHSVLVLEGSGEKRTEMPLLLIRLPDRRRLLAALEARAEPGTLRRDAALREALAEPCDT